ncbi:MAG: intradiol ring-cleavage dioxygenase [Flavobacteriales bacterium]|nr:intradiol ring-cleavage dioxygenase [Flavobacteriales bacterium]
MAPPLSLRTALVSRSLGALLVLQAIHGCSGQDETRSTNDHGRGDRMTMVGGPLENREFTYYGIPKVISPTDTSPGWEQAGQKLLVTGTVLRSDGRTPAPGVLIYYYHTNTEGKYVTNVNEPRNMPPDELGRTHGHIRGWVRTDTAGRYFIYTVRPGVYPTRDAPAHIHATIKEPNAINEYYIDDFVFDDDPLLDAKTRQRMENRCGSGVLRLVQQGDLQIGERNIILGLNIPDHPDASTARVRSGPSVGEDVLSFIPHHAWGPDKGKRVCPVCKYGWYNGVLYFVGDHPNWPKIAIWLTFLEAESRASNGLLKVYFVYGKEAGYDRRARDEELSLLGDSLGLELVALTHVPSFSDVDTEVHLNRIDPQVANTFVLYKRSRVIASFTDLEPTETSYALVREALGSSMNAYFDLPKAEQR